MVAHEGGRRAMVAFVLLVVVQVLANSAELLGGVVHS